VRNRVRILVCGMSMPLPVREIQAVQACRS
jgi:hypothetical protein